MSNLLAQRKEIKRLEKEHENRQKEADEEQNERGEEERGRAVEEFERTMIGLEGGAKTKGKGARVDVPEAQQAKGVKRKFELDEDEMLKNAKEERSKARKAIDDEKVESNPTRPLHFTK